MKSRISHTEAQTVSAAGVKIHFAIVKSPYLPLHLMLYRNQNCFHDIFKNYFP